MHGIYRDPEASGALEKPSQSAAASQPSTELPPVKAEAEEGGMDMMDDVAAMAGHGMSTDPLATLESVLRPVERYAVHFLEEVRPWDAACAGASVTRLHLPGRAELFQQ